MQPIEVPYVESAVVGGSMQDTHVGVNGYGRLPPSAAVVRDSWRRWQEIFAANRELWHAEGVPYVTDEIAGAAGGVSGALRGVRRGLTFEYA